MHPRRPKSDVERMSVSLALHPYVYRYTDLVEQVILITWPGAIVR